MIKDISVLLDGELGGRTPPPARRGYRHRVRRSSYRPLPKSACGACRCDADRRRWCCGAAGRRSRRGGSPARGCRPTETVGALCLGCRFRAKIRRIDAPPGELVDRAVSEARWSDLFVTSRPYDNGLSKWKQLFEALLFESGRGIYVVPPGRQPADVIRRILVAWRDTRETARAVAEATPLIEKAPQTAVVLVNPETGTADAKREPGMDIARHLNRHGTAVEIVMLESENESCERRTPRTGWTNVRRPHRDGRLRSFPGPRVGAGRNDGRDARQVRVPDFPGSLRPVAHCNGSMRFRQ